MPKKSKDRLRDPAFLLTRHGHATYPLTFCTLLFRFEDCAFPPVRTEDFASDLGRRSSGFTSKSEYVGALLDVLKMHKNLCLSRHFQQLDKESLFDTFRFLLFNVYSFVERNLINVSLLEGRTTAQASSLLQ